MLGAIIGDIVGSRFEFVEEVGNRREKNFTLFTPQCKVTDDSCMTLAVARALILAKGNKSELASLVVSSMQTVAKDHPHAGYGISFFKWLQQENPKPYGSYGNGAGMRVSPVGWVAGSEEEVKELSKIVTSVSHDHPEGIKGAEAVAMGVYLARVGASKEEIRKRLAIYYPELNDRLFTIDSLYGQYGYDDTGRWITCQGSIPQALIAFLESTSFEDAIRRAVYIGGDSDTIGTMTGAIAEAYYSPSIEWEDNALEYMSEDLKGIYFAFNKIKKQKEKR